MKLYLCITLLVFIVVTFNSTINSKSVNFFGKSNEINTSKVSYILKNSINEKVEPCEDFYQFVCGNWIKNNNLNKKELLYNDILLEEYNENFVIERLLNNILYNSTSIQMAKIVYNKCLENEKFKNKLNYIKKKCLKFLKESMTYAVDALFIHGNINEDSRNKIIQIIDNLKIAFKEILTHQYSTNRNKLDYVLNKLKDMKYYVAYNNISQNFANLDKYYSGLHINEINTFKEVLNILKVYRKHASKNTIATDRHHYTSTIDASAWYNFYKNKIYLNAGYMNLPFFNVKLLEAMNYGSIGYILGHEMAHAFDTIGLNYNHSEKRYNNKWNDSSNNVYENKIKCFINQYNNYTTLKTKKRINGTRTLNENLADNLGLEAALRAYSSYVHYSKQGEISIPGYERYNNYQLFYIAFGQTHCSHMSYKNELKQIEKGIHSIERYRVIGAISNQEKFKKAFSCNKTSPMNPINKCKLWN